MPSATILVNRHLIPPRVTTTNSASTSNTNYTDINPATLLPVSAGCIAEFKAYLQMIPFHLDDVVQTTAGRCKDDYC